MQILEIHVGYPKNKPYVEIHVDYGFSFTTFNMDKQPTGSEAGYIVEAMPAISAWLKSL